MNTSIGVFAVVLAARSRRLMFDASCVEFWAINRIGATSQGRRLALSDFR
jgi:hypothetical protein